MLKVAVIVLAIVLLLSPPAAAGRSVRDILADIVQAVRHVPTRLSLFERAPPASWYFDVWKSEERRWFAMTHRF